MPDERSGNTPHPPEPERALVEIAPGLYRVVGIRIDQHGRYITDKEGNEDA